MTSASTGQPNTPSSMLSGSRPAASAAARNSPTRSSTVLRPWIGIQPSQYSMMWRNVTGPPAPPMITGGCGNCTGLGQLQLSVKLTWSPSYPAASSHHSPFIANTVSRTWARLERGSTPWFSISSSFQPTPMPNRKRPLDTRSREATDLANVIGWCCATRQIPVPRLRRSVTAAAAARPTNGSSVRRYSSGSSVPPGHGVRRLVGM